MSSNQSSVQPTADRNPTYRKQRRMWRQGQQRQEKSLDSDTSQNEMLPNRDGEIFQRESLPDVQDSGRDNMDFDESKASRKVLMKHIQLLRTELKQSESVQASLQQKCDETEAKVHRMKGYYQEELRVKDRFIFHLQSEKVTYQKKERALESVKKALKASQNANAFLKGQVMKEQENSENLQRVIEAANINVPLVLSGLESNQQQPPIDQDQASPAQTQETPSSIKLLKKLLQAKEREMDALKAQLLEKSSQSNGETQRRVKLLLEENCALLQERNKLQEENTAQKNERDQLRVEVGILKSELSEKVSQEILNQAQIQEEKSALQEEKDALHAQVEKLDSTVLKKSLALKKAHSKLTELQEEKDGLCSELDKQKSAILETTTALQTAQSKVQSLDEEKAALQMEAGGLHSQVGQLKSSLLEKNSALQTAQGKVKTLEEEKDHLFETVENLKDALSIEQKASADAISIVIEQEQEIKQHKATAQTFGQKLKSAQEMFRAYIESCHVRFTAVRAEKEKLEKKVQDLLQEAETLKANFRKEMSLRQTSEEENRALLQQYIKDLYEKLRATQENWFTTLIENHELQQSIEAMLQKKKRRWFGLCFGH